MTPHKSSILFAAVLLLFCTGAGADLYIWTDDQGIRHFSNIAPPDAVVPRVTPEKTISIPRGFSCRVIKIYDGDTIRVKGETLAFKVRLAGIDCPESGWKNVPEQPFAREAKQLLSDLILSEPVVLKQHGTGGYNRVLAEVFFRGENINLKMIRRGLAEVYRGRPPESLDIDEFRQAEKEARRKRKGIWSLGEAYVSPRSWRKRFQDR